MSTTNILPDMKHNKKRTISDVFEDEIEPFVSGNRVEPQSLIFINETTFDNHTESHKANEKNLL